MSAINCPVCLAGDCLPFLERADVPAHQNAVKRSLAEALAVKRGHLRLCICPRCGFVFNQAFDPARLSYDASYDNSQTHSPAFVAHLNQRLAVLFEQHAAGEKRIVEVGCGKGYFLRRLIAAGASNTGYGFDPTYEGERSDYGGRLIFEQRFYDESCVDIPADLVLCRHVIEHIPQPLDLLANVRQALAKSSQARVFFETPCVEWILRHQVVWDFFYEHCSLFSAASLRLAFERAGFSVDQVEHVFGGQYLWLQAGLAAAPAKGAPAGAPALVELALAFARNEQRLLADWRARLERLGQNQRLALWGAGAKGVTLANLVDPRRELLVGLVDLNPNKQGGYLPGTGHPIFAPQELAARGVQTAILMNPNYRAENQALLDQLGLAVQLID